MRQALVRWIVQRYLPFPGLYILPHSVSPFHLGHWDLGQLRVILPFSCPGWGLTAPPGAGLAAYAAARLSRLRSAGHSRQYCPVQLVQIVYLGDGHRGKAGPVYRHVTRPSGTVWLHLLLVLGEKHVPTFF